MSDYYDRNGDPISFERWFELWHEDYKRVAFDSVGDVEVSTVWLGLNHSFLPDSPPIIFETMVFGGPNDEDQERYSTEEEAIEGHRRWVQLVSR
jgi:hypothetical protein